MRSNFSRGRIYAYYTVSVDTPYAVWCNYVLHKAAAAALLLRSARRTSLSSRSECVGCIDCEIVFIYEVEKLVCFA